MVVTVKKCKSSLFPVIESCDASVQMKFQEKLSEGHIQQERADHTCILCGDVAVDASQMERMEGFAGGSSHGEAIKEIAARYRILPSD